MASSSHTFRTREEFKRAKELEEARKAGQIAPEKDEEGNDINPHIPQYISRAPFYLNQNAASLKHHKLSTHLEKVKPEDNINTWYARGQRSGPAATKYRKGACENCGSLTHKTKECVERPRAKGARWTGKDIAADEVVRKVNLGFEAKRDRWNGYDSREYDRVIKAHNRLEDERRRVRAAQVEEDMRTGKHKTESHEEEKPDQDVDEEFKQKDAGEVIVQQKDEGTRVAVRNLRIREDTAKYLRNLDVNSAYYDPKTRSMRQDPTPHIDPDDKDYAGDNFVRVSGELQEFASMQVHSLRAHEDGRDLPDIHAEPSRAEAVYREFQGKKETLEQKKKRAILEKYGGQEHLVDPGEVTALQESEAFVEYTRDGRILRGTEQPATKSKYAEDVLEQNHTSVWGSWYHDGQWGYKCCHQVVRRAYCTGTTGIEAQEAAKDFSSRVKKARQQVTFADETGGKASTQEKQRVEEGEQGILDDRKRKYNSMSADVEVTEEDLETYRLQKQSREDPMYKFVS